MHLFYLIAAILGMALLNALMFVILKNLSDRTGKLIRSSVLRDLSVYDHVLERKLNEALTVNEALKKSAPAVQPFEYDMPQVKTPTGGVLSVANGMYRSESFPRDYRQVKLLSAPNVPEAIAEVKRRALDDEAYQKGCIAAQICSLLPSDAAYELSTLPVKEQEALLRELLTPEQRALLDEHMLLRTQFDLFAFLDEMNSLAFESSGRILVLTGDPTADYGALDPLVDTVYDAGICEGVRIVYRNRLYDYSLLLREVI